MPTVQPPHAHTKIIVVTDKHCVVPTVTGNLGLELTYIRYPERIDVTGETNLCPLGAQLHDKVAALAASLAVQAIEKERMSRQPQQQKQQQ